MTVYVNGARVRDPLDTEWETLTRRAEALERKAIAWGGWLPERDRDELREIFRRCDDLATTEP